MSTPGRTLLFAALITALAGPALAAPWWQGFWAADPAWCRNRGQIGAVETAPIAIIGGEVRGYENSCQIVRVRDMPEVAAVSLMLRCSSEGQSYHEGRLIMQGDRGTIWMRRGVGAPLVFYRCAKPGSNWLQQGK